MSGLIKPTTRHSASKALDKLNDDAIRILCREMGAVKTIRFLNQFDSGQGNYAEERQKWLDEQTVDEIAADIRRLKRQRSPLKSRR